MAMVVATLAAFHDGVAIKNLNLNDGGVWVTNVGLKLAAHLNYPSRTLDGGIQSAAATFDVSQHANTISLQDTSADSIQSISQATLALGSPLKIPAGMTSSEGGTTIAIADPKAGKVWAVDAGTTASFTPTAAPVIRGLPGARVIVGADGAVNAIGTGGRTRRATKQSGAWTAVDSGTMSGITSPAGLDLTTVGDQLVALDPGHAIVHTLKGAVSIPGARGLVLQQPGAAGSAVRLASTTALLSVPLDATAPKTVAAGPSSQPGTPAAPAVVDGCTYAAWAGSGNYRRDCANVNDDRSQVARQLIAATGLQFRVNRSVVVLNNTDNGDVFLVNDNLQLVNNWQDIQAQIQDKKKQSDKTSDQTTQQQDRAKGDQKPVANPDSYGVRPGTTTTLPVLDNDIDPTGDVLLATATTQPSIGRVTSVQGGQALQVTVPATATGSATFKYQITDGHGNSSSSTVTLTVHPTTERNTPPGRKSTAGVLNLAVGGRVSYDVLQDWIDPDGDPIYLKSAASVHGVTLSFNAQGAVTLQSDGTVTSGTVNVPIVVSDGLAGGDAAGVLPVHLQAAGNDKPIANPDFVQVAAGTGALVQPLLNDSDPGGRPLQLSWVSNPPVSTGASVTVDSQSGTFTIQAPKPGDFYLTYKVTNGLTTPATGSVRVQVIAAAKAADPVAQSDVAVLPVGGSVLAPVLDNDTDPLGGVLVLQAVDLPAGSPLQVQVLSHAMLRITAPSGLSGPTPFHYTVSNGSGSAQGQVTVIPSDPPATDAGPIAKPYDVTVRAGDIVSVDVMDQDRSPIGLPLTLQPKLQLVGKSLGTAFVSQNLVRFKAGNAPGDLHLTYTIADSRGNIASSDVHITVRAMDGHNSKPSPLPLTMRVLAGTTTKIAVPLNGIDPDGDSVTLLGVQQAPAKGTVGVENGQLTYTAPPSASGSDVFTYAVADRWGAQGFATVRVGIAPRSDVNHAPVAVADTMTARPDRQLSISVLANDFDPDGDTVSLVPDSVRPVDSRTAVRAGTSGSFVTLTTPSAAGVLHYYYQVSDGRGGLAQGVLTVTVDPKAPLLAPIAQDDVLSPDQVVGRSSVLVDVLANDVDPDGSIFADRLASNAPGVSMVGKELRVPVGKQRQVLLYTVTDPDGNVGEAAVIVPGTDNTLPTVRRDRIPLSANAGQPLTISIPRYVDVRSGHSPQLQNAAGVKAAAGAQVRVVDKATLVFTAPAGFSGLSSVSFPVTDGTSPNDPAGLQATITLPIQVKAVAKTSAPVIQPTAIQVAVGEPAKAVDLVPMVSDPDSGAMAGMKYQIGSATTGFSTSLRGSTLSVGAQSGAKPGLTGHVALTVTAPNGKHATANLPLQVVGSTRPPMAVTTASLTAKAGQSLSIDITQYVTNPFASLGKPLTIVGSPSVRSGSGKAAASGTRVTVTPAADFHGQLTVVYTVADASGQSSRNVQGVIDVSVLGKPDPPVAVSATSNDSHTATVSWTPGASNGAPITDFTVSWAGGSKSCGVVASCTVTGLDNAKPVSFTVVATNAVGASGRSAASPPVTPDVKPNPPGTPVATSGDRQISLTWAAATSDGSKVTQYLVSNGQGDVRQVSGAVTSFVWTGLTNGTAYQFSVVAVNSAKDGHSAPSGTTSAIPMGVPGAVSALSASYSPSSALKQAVTLNWGAADSGGDPAGVTYTVTEDGAATPCTASGCSLQVPSSGDVTFTVTAHNHASVGSGTGAPVSTKVQVYGQSGQVTGLTATPTGSSGQATISFGAPSNLNGAQPGQISYLLSISGGGSQPVQPGQTVGGFTDGSNVGFTVTPVTSGSSGQISGAPATGSVNTFRPPTAPQPTCSVSGNTINCSWSGGSDGGRPASYALGGNASGTVGQSGSYSFGDVGYSATRTLCVTVTTSGGSNQLCSSPATTGAAPVKSATLASPDPASSSFTLTFNNLNPGTYLVKCWNAAQHSPAHETDPGFIGRIGWINFPSTGQMRLACPAPPQAGVFSVEIMGEFWTPAISWP